MSGEDGAERSHEATPKKLEEAREKGELIKSQDVATCAAYIGALLCVVVASPEIGRRILRLGGALLQDPESLSAPLRLGDGGMAGAVLAQSLSIAGLIVAPMAALILAALFAQQAFVFAPSKLEPKMSRISLLSNAKNKFGPSGLFEFAKSGAKMLIFGGLLAYFLSVKIDEIVVSAASDPRSVAAMLPDFIAQFLVFVVVVSGTVAAIDYGWQRHTHLAKNRMTRQEVLDETKQSEGDPHLKAKRRQKGHELASNRMLVDVPEAAVIVVNPTHYAVALKWSPLDPTPPVVIAKGVDELATRIREIATENRIPIFSDPPTARALHATTEIGDPIDRAHFAAVAAAVRFAQDIRKAAQG
ncbi:MAG: flagellar type III secretion system protein FlhB [Jannaschia sp.]